MSKIIPLECPICNLSTNYVYIIDDGKEKSEWYRCDCGVIFQKDEPAHDEYTEKYVAGYAGYNNAKLINIHAARTYVNMIEELTMGRKLLDVGFNLPYNMNYYIDRGWIAKGIDMNPTLGESTNIINGNFETTEFKEDFSLIWMSHVFEHFTDPIKVLRKCHDMLQEDGMLYISTPDIHFISKTGVSRFPHWKKREHKIMWTMDSLARELKRIGFNIIMKRQNFVSRYTGWYDCHIIAQKKYF